VFQLATREMLGRDGASMPRLTRPDGLRPILAGRESSFASDAHCEWKLSSIISSGCEERQCCGFAGRMNG
jgi:hypothetical protein